MDNISGSLDTDDVQLVGRAIRLYSDRGNV